MQQGHCTSSGGTESSPHSVIERYMLQTVARDNLYGSSTRLDKAEPWHRLGGCHRWARAEAVSLLRDPLRERAYYGGLQHCGSPWACPVCSGAIYDHRRYEVKAILDGSRDRGYCLQFVTFTVSHHDGDDLAALLSKLKAATRLVYAGRQWVEYRKACGYIGSIRGVEITRGKNGWHPHIHACWITERGSASETRAYLVPAYLRALARVGLLVEGAAEHGVTVKEWSLTHDEYVAKFDKPARAWDFDAELTMWTRKRGRIGRGLSPWDILRGQVESDDPGHRSLLRGWFREYAGATKGLHSLQFSKGLRAEFGVVERSDEEIAAAGPPYPMTLLALLTVADWRKVVANDCRGELRVIAGRGDVDELLAFLASIGIGPEVLVNQPVGGAGGPSGAGAAGDDDTEDDGDMARPGGGVSAEPVVDIAGYWDWGAWEVDLCPVTLTG